MQSEKPVLIALGGNALILPGERGYINEQFRHADACMAPVAGLIAGGAKVLLTHGNGPIVGNILLRNECARDRIPPMPLSICVADSQGGIGSMMAQSLVNALRRLGRHETVVTIVTHVLVDPGDPAFEEPSKPIGPYYTPEEAEDRMSGGWDMRLIPGRGWRRVVPSPRPVSIVELDAIGNALEGGMIPISCGGGGVPVRAKESGIEGVDAVIDKDLTAALLGRSLGLHTFVILTDVDGVYLDWDRESRKKIDRLTGGEAARYLSDGQFPPGSMGPKIEAAIAFLEGGGRQVIIARPGDLHEALKGRAGTRITEQSIIAGVPWAF